MSPTNEFRFLIRWEGSVEVKSLQQKWSKKHIPTGQTQSESEWRDVPIFRE